MATKTIIVSAHATAEREPDTVSFGFGVQTRSRNTADEASKKCEAAARDIISALIAQGIEERMISTTNVSTVINQERETDRGPYVRYYDCSRDYSVKLPKAMFKFAESGLRIALAKGANSVRNLDWSLSDGPAAELKLAALGNAAENARAKATLLAAKMGASLGSIRNIDDTPYQRPRQPRGDSRYADGGSNGGRQSMMASYKSHSSAVSGDMESAASSSSMPESVVREGAYVTVEYDIADTAPSDVFSSPVSRKEGDSRKETKYPFF